MIQSLASVAAGTMALDGLYGVEDLTDQKCRPREARASGARFPLDKSDNSGAHASVRFSFFPRSLSSIVPNLLLCLACRPLKASLAPSA